jgi:hypothetical protein
MALTKFQLKICREEYELINRVVSYAVASFEVVDLPSLFEKETLESFLVKFDSKKFKLQNKYCFSFNAVEMFIFIKHVGYTMRQMGTYEETVYRMLYDQQIALQVSRAVQIRINYSHKNNV